MKRRTVGIVLASAIVLGLSSFGLILGSLVAAFHYQNKVNEIAFKNCMAIEELKAGQRESALATIRGDLLFLEAHPGGTADFPEAVVRKDIDDKSKTVRRFAARPCKQPDGGTP